MVEKIINDLEAASEAFTVPLRFGEGFSESKFQELCAVLRECARVWADSDSIPKPVALELVDLWPAVQACHDLYEGAEADKVIKAADTIADLTRDIVIPKR